MVFPEDAQFETEYTIGEVMPECVTVPLDTIIKLYSIYEYSEEIVCRRPPHYTKSITWTFCTLNERNFFTFTKEYPNFRWHK